MQCSHNKESWPDLCELLKPIYKKNNIDPILRILINAGVKMTTITEEKLKHGGINWDPYNKLIKQQNGIGWHMIRYRRFAIEWDKLQKRYKTNLLTPKKHYNRYWLGQVISTIWSFGKSWWLYRNQILYPDSKQKYGESREILLDQIRNL